MRISVLPGNHVDLTLRARPDLRCTREGSDIAAVVMNSPYKALLSSRAEQGTVCVCWGGGAERGWLMSDKERKGRIKSARPPCGKP